jgi:hypothetical protein
MRGVGPEQREKKFMSKNRQKWIGVGFAGVFVPPKRLRCMRTYLIHDLVVLD